MVTITNEFLTVEISEKGAELQSITGSDKTEYLWDGNPEYWKGRAPVLFPICGGLKEDKYLYRGREYTLSKHGFAKLSVFTVEVAEKDSTTLLLKSSDETKEHYPFDFELRITYSLDKNKLVTKYSVKNTSDDKMYFSIGSHEAYRVPEGVENYSIEFDKPVTLDAYILDGNLLENRYINVLENGTSLALKDKYFAVDALVFKKVDFQRVTLVNNNGGRRITVEFPECDYFLLWKKPEAKYICLEPWAGVQDIIGSNYDFTKKEGIVSLDGKDEYTKTHTIIFN